MPIGSTVTLTPAEAELFLRTIDGVVAFAGRYPLEFQAFCPPDKFAAVLQTLATAEKNVRGQLAAGLKTIRVDAAALTTVLDIEECLAAAKSARVANVQLALYMSIGGTAAAWLTGYRPLATIGMVSAVGILLLGPGARAANAPPEVVGPDTALKGPARAALGAPKLAGCKPPPPAAKRTVFLERVIVSAPRQVHHWGNVAGAAPGAERAVCLAGPKYLIRVEGFAGMRVAPAAPWGVAPIARCAAAQKAAAVWSPGRRTASSYGPAPTAPPEAYWVVYTGPFTAGGARVAGPFG